MASQTEGMLIACYYVTRVWHAHYASSASNVFIICVGISLNQSLFLPALEVVRALKLLILDLLSRGPHTQ